MSTRASIVATVIAASATIVAVILITADRLGSAKESRISVGPASLYVRTIGTGPAAIVLHGGPDFDHAYLLPDMDRLQDRFRLLYYDQRGRGRSAENVQPTDVTLTTEIEDLDRVRRHFDLEAPVLIGHSWGTVLALEYALRYPSSVSRLILINPAPASTRDFTGLREAYVAKLGSDWDRQREILASAAYRDGDPETVAARYRIHFKHALHRPEDYERLMAAMRAQFIGQGREGILRAQAIEEQLMRSSWRRDDYDLLPKLRALSIPTLVITGKQDFIPVEIASRIARSIPDAQLVVIENCGHFSYLECSDEVSAAIDEHLRR